jgi:hypothetical protein
MLASVQLCLAGSGRLPAETSFAYVISHPIAPLPEAGVGPWAIVDGGEFGKAGTDDGAAIPVPAPRPISRANVCNAVASAARANDLPVPFFANLIWQESNFNPRVVSPAGAQGIAQFMPETARQYGLVNPFDPIHALNAAGRFLNKLVAQFGNLGLAAAAYNAGPGRVNDFVNRRRQLPGETKDYVVRITGHPAEKWTSSAFVRVPEAKLMPAKAPCVEVAQEVAAQAKAVQLAKLGAASRAHPVRIAHATKGRTARLVASIRKSASTVIAKATTVAKSTQKSAAVRISAKRTRVAAAN